jgi:hypothetical protein
MINSIFKNVGYVKQDINYKYQRIHNVWKMKDLYQDVKNIMLIILLYAKHVNSDID